MIRACTARCGQFKLPPQVQARQDQTVQETEVCASGKTLFFEVQLSPLQCLKLLYMHFKHHYQKRRTKMTIQKIQPLVEIDNMQYVPKISLAPFLKRGKGTVCLCADQLQLLNHFHETLPNALYLHFLQSVELTWQKRENEKGTTVPPIRVRS